MPVGGGRERCLAAGMDDYLTKPVRPDRLDAVLARWLSTGTDNDAPEALEGRVEGGSKIDARGVTGIFAGFDVDSRGELLDIFETATRHSLADLCVAVQAADGDEIRRLAHLMKGGAATLGARAFSAACHALEVGVTEDGAEAVNAEDVDHLAEIARICQLQLRAQLLEV